MNYLLIAFALLMALAPLTHFLPSKRQRLQVKLREAAAVSGLFVEFRDLPGSSRKQPPLRPEVIYYGLRLRASKGRPRRRSAWLQQDGEWRSVGPGQAEPLPTILRQCPVAILAASMHEDSCGLYWQETGDSASVEEMAAVLKDWSAQIP